MYRPLLILSLMLSGLQSCKDNVSEEYDSKGAEYYPYQSLNVREYIYDSVHYNRLLSKVTKYKFFITENVLEKFKDQQGDSVYRIEQYVSKDTGKTYQFLALHVLKADEAGMQRVEENQRYQKIVRPISDKKRWNGNLFNNLGFEEYQYDGIGKPHSNDWYDFNDCIIVSQQNDSTVISSDQKKEIYAKGFGLVYKLKKSIRYDFTKPPEGYIVEWRLKQFWEK